MVNEVMKFITEHDPEVGKAIEAEYARQKRNIELIASENIVSEAVMMAMGTVLTNKYAEGFPGKRYYGGCECVDVVENIAIERAKKLFGAEHACVQPHSGASANIAVYFALLKPGDTVLGLNLAHGGHLTHGSPVNLSGTYYNFIPYSLDDTERINYDKVRELALEHKPKMIVAGASAYPREIRFDKFAEIAHEVGAYLFVDMAHIAGLVAAGLHQNPVPYADVVTTTTHKTLRGPRGGLILCKESLAKQINKAVFPGTQGGPLEHIIAMAAGAVVVSLCSTSDETIEEAEKDLPRNLCPLIKSSYGFGKTDKCPYFYFSDLVVGETTCDGKKKMYEYMAEFKAVHVMQLPNSASDAASRALWKAEILRLQQVIEARFGAPISEAALREAIVLKNRERRALAHFYRLGQLNPPALSGGDILKVVYGATFRFDKTALIDELNAMAERIRQEWRQGKRLASRPRILITGCPIGGAAEKVVRAIEENGGWVVGYENCTGAKATERCVAEEGDVYDALTDKYLAIGCSCISPNHQRLQLLSQMVEEYQADGVIDVILQACHTYAVESLAIKRHLRQQHDLPYMAIETDYSTADLGQLSTRVAAFIEML